MDVFKRRDFARWQTREKMPDHALCTAVKEMACGLVNAELGGGLYKKRIARAGEGKRSGYRTLLAARTGERYVFLHAFSKGDRAKITPEETRALRFAAKVFLGLSAQDLLKTLETGVLLEVHCNEQDH
ncbi:hypothetical protein CEK62_10205 [Alcanivorax sp. N3-2A]|nr:hypothetical protein CEK62_10205 [Alcanivorax sp. N3-2A]|tara:strand:+ start:7344 stop:7727 length:384 start_codon:yes stop_codon:yes gene_type:complete